MQNLIEFVVTCHTEEDCDSFSTDIENDGGSITIPNRAVSVYKRRPLSLSTHYMLTPEEAEQVRNDPRVRAVEFAQLIRDSIKPLGYSVYDINFNKSSTSSNTFFNWGLHRCYKGEQITNWGSNSEPNQNSEFIITATGKNVDVIIVDGHFNPDHVEYAVNEDGTGGSRVNQFDWYSLNSTVSSIDDDAATLLTGTYVYPTNFNDGNTQRTADNNHGAHVAGIVVGTKQGWAKDANIYNISPYSTNANSLDSLALWDYIRAFHRNKAVNPVTGRKNPTIVNASYGSFLPFPSDALGLSAITKVTVRGVDTYSGGANLTSTQLTNSKVYNTSGAVTVNFWTSGVTSDVEQAIADGIIVVAAAGNYSQLIDANASYVGANSNTGLDYNNTFEAKYLGVNYFWYAHRATPPSSANGAICVGAISTLINESKATYSATGPRVDIFAPGNQIMSSLNNTVSYGGVNDIRGTSNTIGKISGTSMASPQVCGVLACMLEVYPNWTSYDAKEWLRKWAKENQMTETYGNISDTTSLQGALNKYLYYRTERLYTGNVFTTPKNDYGIRSSSGSIYPRVKRKFFK